VVQADNVAFLEARCCRPTRHVRMTRGIRGTLVEQHKKNLSQYNVALSVK
jgi:hypothetical protein